MKKKLLYCLFALISLNGFAQNNYLDFDGTNDNIIVNNSGNVLAGSSTISMCFKVFPKNANPSYPAFDGFAGYRNDSNFDFYIIQLSSNEIEARFRNSSGTTFTITYNGLILNQWNQFFLVYNGSFLTLFSGANEVASIPANGSVPVNNTSLFRIGNIAYSINNFYHKGYMDEVSLWSKALSPTEIDNIVINNGEIALPSNQSNLEIYYKFNQGLAYGNNSGVTTLIDEMGAFDGTLTNFALTGNISNWGGQNQMSTANFDEVNMFAYPNPISTMLNFSGLSEKISIKIVDLSGRIVFNKKDIDSKFIEISTLDNGIYTAIVNETHHIKFIKN